MCDGKGREREGRTHLTPQQNLPPPPLSLKNPLLCSVPPSSPLSPLSFASLFFATLRSFFSLGLPPPLIEDKIGPRPTEDTEEPTLESEELLPLRPHRGGTGASSLESGGESDIESSAELEEDEEEEDEELRTEGFRARWSFEVSVRL